MLSIDALLNISTPQPLVTFDGNYLDTMGMANQRDKRGNANRTFIARQEGGTAAETQRYEAAFERQGQLWGARLEEEIMVERISTLQVGYRTDFSLEGYSLGHICRVLAGVYGRGILKGLFFTGKTFDFKTNLEYGAPSHIYDVIRDTERWVTPRFLQRSVDSVFIRYFPLTKVNWLDPVQPFETWQEYYEEISQIEGGSDMNGFTFLEDSFICRMAPPGRNIMMKIHNTRTAGLSNIITHPINTTFTMVQQQGGDEEDDVEVEYRLFLPCGMDNCVESGFLWLCHLYFHSDEGLGERAGWDYDQWKEWWESFFKIMQKGGDSRKNKKVKKMGYTTRDLRLLYESAKSVGIYCHLYYEVEVERWGDRMGKDGSGHIRNSYEIENYDRHFCLLQMNEMGYIYSNILHYYLHKEASDDTTASNLLHAIVIYPHPPRKYFHKYAWREEFRKKIEKITTEAMQTFVTDMKGEGFGVSLREDFLENLVLYQKTRYEADLTNTLIFKESKHLTPTYHWYKKKKDTTPHDGAEEKKPETIIYAYDLETVTNTNACQPRVWKHFRKPVLQHAEPLESQIPFSAQWCAVNVSDEGKFAERKHLADIELNEYVSDISLDYATVPAAKPTIEEPSIRVADYLLSEPVTEYGQQKLGKCVEDMLQNMACDVVKRGGKNAVAYAHNGAGFDAYVILQFCRFKVDRILKTSRGIMSVTFLVPCFKEDQEVVGGNNNNITIPIALRDTRLHVSGSLAALCKGFGVPPSWCKLDFPIDKVNYTNCYHPDILAICEPYGVNDIKALAFIIVKINQLIGDSRWDPCEVTNNRPPIAQFLTCMSMVRASTRNHFLKSLRIQQLPRALDVPALRIWLEKATIGGRVNAYAKTYVSAYFERILLAYMADKVDVLKLYHEVILSENACMVVEDETSLYPATLAKCPMPTGMIHFITASTARHMIMLMGCDECDRGFALCAVHDLQQQSQEVRGTRVAADYYRPFAIIRVKSLRWSPFAKANALRVLCPRRLSSTIPTAGLEYTLENDDEMADRYGKGAAGVLPLIQSFTNIDLYWMERCGMEFEVLDGFSFEVSDIYSSFIGPAFAERIKAKQEGNKLLSDFLKLNYNGAFGVTAQQNIDSSTSLVTLPEELRSIHPSDPEVLKYILHQHSVEVGADEEIGDDSYVLPSGQTLLTKKKKSHVAEYYMAQSPVQIGCAILAYARHIVNLVMCNLPEESQTYTDTDSIAMDETSRKLLEAAGIINNTDSAPLGTLKNDHMDGNGQEPRVILSLIGAKKVKMHVTLNEKGELRIFNTFKGLNPSDKNEEGKRMPGNWVEHQIATALNEISQYGGCNPMKVAQWRKSVGFGVKIGEHMQEMKTETYLAHSKGLVGVHKLGKGYYEFFLPHGSEMRLPPHTFFPISIKEETTNLKKKDHIYEIARPEERKRELELAGLVWDQLQRMFDKYYEISGGNTYDDVHRLESSEYNSILSVFENLS